MYFHRGVQLEPIIRLPSTSHGYWEIPKGTKASSQSTACPSRFSRCKMDYMHFMATCGKAIGIFVYHLEAAAGIIPLTREKKDYFHLNSPFKCARGHVSSGAAWEVSGETMIKLVSMYNHH